MKKIGLIAGSGKFPLIVMKMFSKRNDELVVIGIKDYVNKSLKKLSKKIYIVELGNISRIINILHKEKIKEVAMVGKIDKSILFRNFRADKKAAKILKKLKDKKDMTILNSIVALFMKEKIKLLHPSVYISPLLSTSGILTKRRPNENEWRDIIFGFNIIKKIADLDVGQSIAIRDRMVVAVEAMEGTDNMIRRAYDVSNGKFTIVKVSRNGQDMRLDLPVVGPSTIDIMQKCKSTCLAIESGMTIILDKELFIKKANKAKISVIGVNY